MRIARILPSTIGDPASGRTGYELGRSRLRAIIANLAITLRLTLPVQDRPLDLLRGLCDVCPRDQTVAIRTGNSTRVELLLPVGVLQQLVEAIDRIPPLDYDKHGIAGVVSRFQIENLPLNGREFLRLAVLEPGVTAAPSAGYFSRQFDVSVMSAPAERTRTTMDGGPIYGPATAGRSSEPHSTVRRPQQH